MTNVDALKALYVALGGSADDVVNISLISDMISKIATLVTTNNIGSQIPSLSGVTDGYVLTADGGEAKWAAIPAGWQI